MQSYCFTLRHGGAGNEDLGDVPLTDDSEAFAFARDIIRELMQRDAADYADAAMGIAQGKRIVGSVAFDFDVALKQRKYG